METRPDLLELTAITAVVSLTSQRCSAIRRRLSSPMPTIPNNRTPQAAVSNLVVQLGVAMAGNLLKEFWPDLAGKFSRKRQPTKPPVK
jgi:hypothetical protein